MTFGRLDLGLNYPEKQALYQVPVRHNSCLHPASFRFLVTQDTFAFSYKIPAITVLKGLEAFCPAPSRFITCPAHPPEHPYGMNFGLSLSIWDYLFGTAYIPYDGRDIELGFHGDDDFPKGFGNQTAFPFREEK